MKMILPKWYDLHAHFRQDELLVHTVKDHIKMACAGMLAMPNTKPPVAKVLESDTAACMSIEAYRADILAAGEDVLEAVIVPLYLTAQTTPKMITQGAASGLLKACKYYPPHGTTGAEFGAPLETFIENGVFQAMEEADITLCIHGEEHGLEAEQYFDRAENAEEIFYKTQMPALLKACPKLKIVGEHITTKVAVDFIKAAPAHVKATITPQHLLYTVGHLLQGLKYHLYCLPLLKYEEDRAALRAAVSDGENTKFFAGTDSAPHTEKMTPCGCAAGCYTGGIAPQLYAQGFEEAGVNLSAPDGQACFKKFLCMIGPEFYGLPIPSDTFILERKPQPVNSLTLGEQELTPLPLGIGEAEIPWSLSKD